MKEVQLQVDEVRNLVQLCQEYKKPIDYVINKIASNMEEYEWLFDVGVGVAYTLIFDPHSKDKNPILDAYFFGMRNERISNKYKNKSEYHKIIINFQNIPRIFSDEYVQRKIYTLLHSNSVNDLFRFG